MKAIGIVVGLVLAGLAVLFAVFTFIVKPRQAAPAQQTIVQAPPPVVKTDRTSSRINAGANLVGAIAGAAGSLGLKF